MIVVTDAGPLIYLAGAGELQVLQDIFDAVIVPRVVYEEVTVAGAGRVGAAEVAGASWLRVEDEAPDQDLLAILDAGEAAAIPLAERYHAMLLVDDAAARAAAQGRGLQVVGTLGVLLLAKRGGHVPLVAPILERMARLGMYVSAELRERVLRAAGE